MTSNHIQKLLGSFFGGLVCGFKRAGACWIVVLVCAAELFPSNIQAAALERPAQSPVTIKSGHQRIFDAADGPWVNGASMPVRGTAFDQVMPKNEHFAAQIVTSHFPALPVNQSRPSYDSDHRSDESGKEFVPVDTWGRWCLRHIFLVVTVPIVAWVVGCMAWMAYDTRRLDRKWVEQLSRGEPLL